MAPASIPACHAAHPCRSGPRSTFPLVLLPVRRLLGFSARRLFLRALADLRRCGCGFHRLAVDQDLRTGCVVGRLFFLLVVLLGRLLVGHGLEALLLSELVLVVVAAVVLGDAEEDEAVRDAEDVVQPEQVEGLQTAQQRRRDVVRDPALVLLRLPVQLVGPDRLELVELRPENPEVEVVSQVAPRNHEEPEVGPHQRVVEIIECFRRL